MVICARMVLSVATTAITLNVEGLKPATVRYTKLSGAGDAASCSGDTALTAMAATTIYSTDVMTSVSAMARGMSRRGDLASSTTLARSSKPIKAKNASRLANAMPDNVAASSGGTATRTGTNATPECIAVAMISSSPPTSISVNRLASRTDSKMPHAATAPSTMMIAPAINGVGSSTNCLTYPLPPSVTAADATMPVASVSRPTAVDNRRDPNAARMYAASPALTG